MKSIIALCVVLFAAYAIAERCQNVGGCKETNCVNADGWFLHCTSGYCVCQHDTHTGQACNDGLTSTCDAIHDSRCADHGLHWRCLDNVCHCTKY